MQIKLSQLFKTLALSLLASPVALAQDNTLLNPKFWQGKPTLAAVEAEVSMGNDPTESNGARFDPLTWAINAGTTPEVARYMLDFEGNSVHKLTHHLRSYLHWASAAGDLEIVRLLLERGSDMNLADEHGATPLFYALERGKGDQRALIELYAQHGYDLKQTNARGESLLHLVASKDKGLQLTDYLLGRGLDLHAKDKRGASVADHAARSGNLEQIKAFVSRGVKLSHQALLIAASGTRGSATSLEVYQYLIQEQGLSAHIRAEDGATVLHLIAGKPEQATIAQYFVGLGLDPRLVNEAGSTALMLSTTAKDTALLQYLIQIAPAPKQIDQFGGTALTYATVSGSVEAMRLLLGAGWDAKRKDIQGYDIGYHLVRHYRSAPAGPAGQQSNAGLATFTEKLKLLVGAGYDPKARQGDGSTLLHHIASRNQLDLLEALLPYGLDINAQDEQGLTPLHRAALTARDGKMLARLLELGADKSLQTEMGETAYDIARESELLAEADIDLSFLK